MLGFHRVKFEVRKHFTRVYPVKFEVRKYFTGEGAYFMVVPGLLAPTCHNHNPARETFCSLHSQNGSGFRVLVTYNQVSSNQYHLSRSPQHPFLNTDSARSYGPWQVSPQPNTIRLYISAQALRSVPLADCRLPAAYWFLTSISITNFHFPLKKRKPSYDESGP